MKRYKRTCWVITLFLVLNPGSCSTTKRRLCIEYKKENYLSETKYIAMLHAETENICMVSCVRRSPCMAFNYNVMNKTCILMPRLNCMAPNVIDNSWYLLVHLQPCKLEAVWSSYRPVHRNWQWIITKHPGNNADTVKLTSGYTRYVTRALYRGYYLPGWWMADGQKFRAVDPVTMKDKKCKYGEFLAFPDPSSYWWTPYTAGDSLPDCALPLSQLPDGTPLYIVRHGSDTVSGFYDQLTKSTYFVYWGVINPKAVDILCGNNA